MIPITAQQRRKINGWKAAFWLLVALLAAGAGLVLILLTKPAATQPAEDQAAETAAENQEGLSPFGITAAEQDLEILLQSYFDQQVDPDYQLKIVLDDQIELTGRTTLIGLTVPFAISAEPFATQEGDLQLKITAVSAGAISLPQQTVLQVISSQLKDLEAAVIDPAARTVTLDLTELLGREDVTVKLERIDKDSHQYVFTVYTVTKNLLK